jgi:hypothetical protein
MKKKTLITLIIIATGIVIALGALWPIIAKYRIKNFAQVTLAEFETSIMNNDSIKAVRRIFPATAYYQMITENGIAPLRDGLQKFKPGSTIKVVSYGECTLPKDTCSTYRLLSVQLVKIAKTNHRRIIIDNVHLIRKNDKWYVLQYYVPEVEED